MNTQNGRTRRALALKQATAFFYEHAGYSYDPKTETPEQGKKRCAVALARAERDAASAGIRFTWEYDPDGCIGCGCATGAEHTVETCFAVKDGECVASLGSICEATDTYRRVIEAELAYEALA
jgi:hypothetical protein